MLDLEEIDLRAHTEGASPARSRAGRQAMSNISHRPGPRGAAFTGGKIDKHRADAKLKKF